MHFNTAYNHKVRLQNIVRDIFSSAKIYGLTSDNIAVKLNDKVYRDPGHRRCPTWVRSFLMGYIDAKREVVASDIQFMYDLGNNRFVPLKTLVHEEICAIQKIGYKDIKSVYLWKDTGKIYSETGLTFDCDGLQVVYGVHTKYFRVHRPEAKKWYLVHAIGEDADILKDIFTVMGWQSLINYLDMNYTGWDK